MAIETKEHLWGNYKKLPVCVKIGIIMLPPLHCSLTVEGSKPQAQKVTLLKSWLVSTWVWNPEGCPPHSMVMFLPCPVPPTTTQFTSRTTPRTKGLVRDQHGWTSLLWMLRVVTSPPRGASDTLNYHQLPGWPRESHLEEVEKVAKKAAGSGGGDTQPWV